MNFRITSSVLLFVLLGIGYHAMAQTAEDRHRHFNTNKGLALQGYDPVSYFDGTPQEGDEKWSHTYRGVRYHFSSAANRARFQAAPEKFEPAYGGWCAYAMGETGEKVKIDPETFKIVAGRLYLFYNFWGNNTLVDWNKNEAALKTQADLNWKKFDR